jgi:hypothetical protein
MKTRSICQHENWQTPTKFFSEAAQQLRERGTPPRPMAREQLGRRSALWPVISGHAIVQATEQH